MRKLFYNGDILTMESPQPAGAVLTEGGRILAVGDLQVLGRMAGRQTELIDLGGGALLPGFCVGDGDFLAAVRACLAERETASEQGRWGWRGTARAGTRELRAAVGTAAERYASRGITLLHQREITAEQWRLLAHSGLPMPLMAAADVEAYEEVKRAAAGGREGMYLCGMSLTLDALAESAEPTGETAYSDRAVSYALRMAAAEGAQMTVRAASGAAIAQFLRVMRAMVRVCPELYATRPVLLDARALSPTEMEQVCHLGVIPCYAADVISRQGDDHLHTLGMERAARLTPFASTKQAGVPYLLADGTSNGIPSPLNLLCAAVTRQTARGVVLGAAECASVYDALRALTVHGAWRYHAERAFGSIRAGMRADLVWLNRDPLAVPSGELGEIRVCGTFCAGEPMWLAQNHEFSTRSDRVLTVY